MPQIYHVSGHRIQLRGGPKPAEGNVYIKDHQNVWKPVCDDGWHIADATVACRMLG